MKEKKVSMLSLLLGFHNTCPVEISFFFRDEYAETKTARLEKLINRFKAEGGPFHGLGLFEVTSSTLMGLISTILTYVIIVVQFQPKKTNCKQLMAKSRNKIQ